MTKDRLAELRQFQTTPDGEDMVEIELEVTNKTTNDTNNMLEAFFEQIEKIKSVITQLEGYVERINKLNNFFLSSLDEKDRSELEELNDSIRSEARRVTSSLKKVTDFELFENFLSRFEFLVGPRK